MNILILNSSCRLCLESDGIMENIFSSPDLATRIEEITSFNVCILREIDSWVINSLSSPVNSDF